MRVLDKDGKPGSLEDFEFVIKLNLTGCFNALRLGAARMARPSRSTASAARSC